jgi:hypothetical protein
LIARSQEELEPQPLLALIVIVDGADKENNHDKPTT